MNPNRSQLYHQLQSSKKVLFSRLYTVPELEILYILRIPKIEIFSVKQIQFLIAKIVFLCLCLNYQPVEFIEFAASAATLQEIIFQGPTRWWYWIYLYVCFC